MTVIRLLVFCLQKYVLLLRDGTHIQHVQKVLSIIFFFSLLFFYLIEYKIGI